jgi:hypothetical protein
VRITVVLPVSVEVDARWDDHEGAAEVIDVSTGTVGDVLESLDSEGRLEELDELVRRAIEGADKLDGSIAGPGGKVSNR